MTLFLPSFIAAAGTGLVFSNASAGAFTIFYKHLGSVGALYGFFQVILTACLGFMLSYLNLISINILGWSLFAIGVLSIATYLCIPVKEIDTNLPPK